MAYGIGARSVSGLLYILCIFQLCFFLYIGTKREKDFFSFWISPLYILLLGLVIVNLQTFANLLLKWGELNDYFLVQGSFSKYEFPVLCLSVMSMSFFYIGVLNYKKRKNYTEQSGLHPTTIVNFALLLSLFYFIATINIGDFISGEVYKGSGASDAGVADYGYSERFLDSMIIIALAVYSFNIKQKGIIGIARWIKKIPLVFWVVVGIYMGLRLISGDRGPVIYTSCAILFSCYYCTHFTIKLGFAIIGLAISAILMAVISFARVTTGNASFEERMRLGNEAMTAIETKNVSPVTQELAYSNEIIYIIMSDIDKGKTDYKMGKNVMTSLIMSFPGIGVIMKSLYGDVIFDTKNSAEYSTISMLGEDYIFGLGSSVLGDFYYDLGVVGCCLGFLLLGIIYKQLTYTLMYGKNVPVISLLFILKLSSLSIYISRSTLWANIGSAIFILVIYLILRLLIYIKL